MNDCARQQEILEAVAAQRWPDALNPDLAAHTAACETCRDLAIVAQAFREDHLHALEHSRIPSAGLVWWRAEIRMRQEAVRAASRPIRFVEAVAALCGVAAAASLLMRPGLVSPGFLRSGTEGLRQFVIDLPASVHLACLAAVFLVVLAPFAFYFVASDE